MLSFFSLLYIKHSYREMQVKFHPIFFSLLSYVHINPPL